MNVNISNEFNFSEVPEHKTTLRCDYSKTIAG